MERRTDLNDSEDSAEAYSEYEHEEKHAMNNTWVTLCVEYG